MDNRLRDIADFLMSLKDSSAFSPARIGAKLLPHLFILDIERDPHSAAIRLRIRLIGTSIDQFFRRPMRDRMLEDFIHGPRGRNVIEAFHHTATTHEPLWMRQVMQLDNRPARFVEGVCVYLEPQRIYGGLMMGDTTETVTVGFEQLSLLKPPSSP